MIQQLHISQFKARLTAIYSLGLFHFKKGGLFCQILYLKNMLCS